MPGVDAHYRNFFLAYPHGGAQERAVAAEAHGKVRFKVGIVGDRSDGGECLRYYLEKMAVQFAVHNNVDRPPA